ncbi:MAG: hypothetical protein U0441_39065 [Polyangiaceae bacterium]
MLSLRRLAPLLCLSVTTGCVQKTLIFDKTVPLPDGRFSAPVALDLPRRVEHKNHDFEIHAVLRAACDPRLTVSFPDGETGTLGLDDEDWQSLLAHRAAAGAAADKPPASPAPPAGPAPPGPRTGIYGPMLPPGHFEAVLTESWAGQLTFLAERPVRCAASREYEVVYLNALDESGKITFWGDPPQEMAGGSLSVKVFEILEDEASADASGGVSGGGRVSGGVKVSVKIPPMPEPRKENPPPAQDPGAVWVPGYWTWSPGSEKWEWSYGHWGPPAQTPPLQQENTGPAPNPGCTWASGYWTWTSTPGKWEWHPGHWNAPPPKQEDPGSPEVPEQSWVAGFWVEVSGHFEWRPGHWGPPRPRAETPSPQPTSGARWVSGMWIHANGKWVWSPGYWEISGRPPPAPKAETPPPSPGHGAVWLGGFWRWSTDKNDYVWIAGHWESPPGEGYVWVPDPPGPSGVSIGGRWVLQVDVHVGGSVKVKP